MATAYDQNIRNRPTGQYVNGQEVKYSGPEAGFNAVANPASAAPHDPNVAGTTSQGTYRTDPTTGKNYFVPNGASTPSPYYPRYTDQPAAAPQVQSAEEIQAQKMKDSQAQIDSLNSYYDTLAREQATINESRSRATSSVNTLTGLAGSTEANVQTDKTTALNQQATDKIQAERNAALQQVLADVRTSAVQEAQFQRQQANADAQTQLEQRKQIQTEATTQLTALAQGGATADGIKASDPVAYQHLVDTLGGEATVKAMFTLNRPQDAILDKSIQNGNYVIAYQNPLTGKVRIETVDLGLPTGYSKTIDAGNRILAVPDNWDGDPSKLISINKGLTPDQAASLSGAGGASGLSPSSVNFWADAAASGVSMNSLIPSLGMGKAGVATKQAILDRIASNSATLGIDGSTFAAMLTDSRAKQKAYDQVQKNGTLLAVNEQNAEKNLNLVLSLSKKIDDSTLRVASPVLEGWLQTGQVKLGGNADVNNFNSALVTAMTEYAKVVTGQTSGQAVTDSARQEMQTLLDRGLSTAAIESWINNAAIPEMKNRTSSYDSAVTSLFSAIQDVKTVPNGLGMTGATNDTSAMTPMQGSDGNTYYQDTNGDIYDESGNLVQ